jgi:hypothetical protein
MKTPYTEIAKSAELATDAAVAEALLLVCSKLDTLTQAVVRIEKLLDSATISGGMDDSRYFNVSS